MEYPVTEIALSDLKLSPKNVRKTPPTQQAQDELLASIVAKGLIYQLVVEPSPRRNGAEYHVVAGGRRLAVYQRLAKEGAIAKDHAIRCSIAPEGVDPAEISYIENAIRAEMHPADQITAFAGFAERGASNAQIAQHYGVSERTVEKRLRLGRVAPELLDAFRRDEMNLRTLEAFTLTPDQDRQRAVWEAVSKMPSYYGNIAHRVHNALTEKHMSGAHPIARYAGIEKYEAAGGRVVRDLFPETDTDTWLEDPEIARQVATERLETHAKRLKREWSWVETMLEAPEHHVLRRFARIEPKPTDEEATRLSAIEDRIEAIYDSEEGVDDDGHKELRTLREEQRQIHRAVDKRPLTDAQRNIAGCIIGIAHNGQPDVQKGLVRPEDIPDEATAEGEGAGTDPVSIARDHLPPKKPPSFYSDSFATSLRALRTTHVKVELARDPATAFDLLLYEMARHLLPNASPRYLDGPLSLTVTPTRSAPAIATDEAFAATAAEQDALLDAAGEALPADWLRHESSEARFRALCELEPEVKHAMFAWCVAQLVRPQLSYDSDRVGATEVAIARLNTEPHVAFRPGAAFYWKKLNKRQLLQIATDVLGPAWAEKHRKDKKGDLIVFMEQAFSDPGADPDVPAQAHEVVHAWAMPGFAAFASDPLAPPAMEEGGETDPALDATPPAEAPATPPADGDTELPAFLDA